MDMYIYQLFMRNRKMTDVDLKNNVNEKYALKINVTTIKIAYSNLGSWDE